MEVSINSGRSEASEASIYDAVDGLEKLVAHQAEAIQLRDKLIEHLEQVIVIRDQIIETLVKEVNEWRQKAGVKPLSRKLT